MNIQFKKSLLTALLGVSSLLPLTADAANIFIGDGYRWPGGPANTIPTGQLSFEWCFFDGGGGSVSQGSFSSGGNTSCAGVQRPESNGGLHFVGSYGLSGGFTNVSRTVYFVQGGNQISNILSWTAVGNGNGTATITVDFSSDDVTNLGILPGNVDPSDIVTLSLNQATGFSFSTANLTADIVIEASESAPLPNAQSVPLPGTLALLGLGLGALGLNRRTRKPRA